MIIFACWFSVNIFKTQKYKDDEKVTPDDTGIIHLWNVGKCVLDYKSQAGIVIFWIILCNIDSYVSPIKFNQNSSENVTSLQAGNYIIYDVR